MQNDDSDTFNCTMEAEIVGAWCSRSTKVVPLAYQKLKARMVSHPSYKLILGYI